VFQISGLFLFFCFRFWNIFIDIIFWEWDPSLNMKFIYVLYTPYTHSLNVILYKVLCFDCDLSHKVRLQYSTFGNMLALKKFQILNFSD
jgi:hypothetical protein